MKAAKKVIGSLGLHYSWTNNEKDFAALRIKELGYVLSKAYWGQVLMPEAVNAVIDYCFNELGLGALTVGHFVSNAQSQRVIEKSGFMYVTQGTYYAKGVNKTLRKTNIFYLEDNTKWIFYFSIKNIFFPIESAAY